MVCVGLMAVGGLAACQKKAAEAAKTGEATQATAKAPAGPISLPHRKAGLWSQTMSTAGMKQTMKICFDNDTESKMTAWGQAKSDHSCAKEAIMPVPGGWKVDSVCDMGEAGTIATTGTITGDFNGSYTMKMSSTTTGAKMAQANGTHEMEMTAKWEGPCPAGMKGGDMQMAGMPAGMTMNLEKMQAMAGKK
jgi:hypothetical protein